MAEKQLVPSDAGTQTNPHPAPSTDTHSDSPEKVCIRFILDNRESTFMDFMLLARKLNKGMEHENTIFSESHKKTSSQKQYNSSWKSGRNMCVTKNQSL